MLGNQRKWSRIGVARICEGECMGHNPGNKSLTLMICHNYMKPLKDGSPFVAELIT